MSDLYIFACRLNFLYFVLWLDMWFSNIPQQDVKLDLDDPPTQDEVRSAIAKLKCHKTPGIDGRPAEVYNTS